MTKRPSLALASAVLALSIGGCGQSRPSSSAPAGVSLAPGEVAAPTYQTIVDGATVACAGVGFELDVRVHGSPSDPSVAWVVFPDGHRENLLWPPGYVARFRPSLEIVDPTGHVVARENERATGGCPMPPDGLLIDLPTVPASPVP
jgi:hypothetical protein